MSSKIIVTGGGTGGHVFPALSIADELKNRQFEIIYAGSRQGFEGKVVPAKGYPFFAVDSGAVKNQTLAKKIKSLAQLTNGIWRSWLFLGKEKPLAVLGVGGFVSVPMGVAAFMRGIPLYIQEQNVSVGIANRMLGKLARRIFLGFEDAKTYFPISRCITSGNPIRQEFLVFNFPKFDPEARSILIFGGSQGAKAINDAVIELLPTLNKNYPNLSIVHQTGERDLHRVEEAYQTKFSGKYQVVPFIDDMAKAYANCSMVVSRSGALTISELVQVGRPALLIPFPRKGQNDQTSNAKLLESHGVALVVEQGKQFQERFEKAFHEMFTPAVLSKMAKNFSALRGGNALVTIGDQIEADLRPR